MTKSFLIITFVFDILLLLFHIICLVFDDNKMKWMLWLLSDLIFVIPCNVFLLKRSK